MKKMTSLLTILLSVSAVASTDLVKNLTSTDLPDASRPSAVSDQVLNRIRIGAPPSAEGVESNELPDVPKPHVYSTKAMIEKTLERSRALATGQRIQFFEQAAANIILSSGVNENEEIVRMTINRSVDVVNTVLPVMGRNTAEVARLTANFYEESFKLALRYSLEPCRLVTIHHPNRDFKPVLLADYGVEFSRLMFGFSQTIASRSQKAIVLIKTLGFLGWDLNLDLRAREQSFQDLLSSVFEIQKESVQMRNILASIARDEEPSNADTAWLRSQVKSVLDASWKIVPASRIWK